MKKTCLYLCAAACFIAMSALPSCDNSPPAESENLTATDDDFIAESSSYDSPNSSEISPEDTPENPQPDANEEVFDFLREEDGITITGLKQNVVDLRIPGAIGGLNVISIAENAFAEQKQIRSVSFDFGVKRIGKSALRNCTSLNFATIPESVEFIGYAAFGGCSALKEMRLPFTGEEEKTSVSLKSYPFGYIFGEENYPGGTQTVQYYYDDSLEYVDSAAYYIPTGLKTVFISGKGETHLPYDAFRSCENLEKITLGNKITSVGKFAFSCCYAEIEWLDPTIEKIDEYAYADYKGTKLILPASIERIDKCAFEDCENLKELIVPDGVDNIDIFAFRGCTSMTKAVLGKNVKKLGVNAFYFCTALKEISLPAGLEEICDSAFLCCRALEKIDLPENLRIIGADAFKDCSRLASITFENPNGWRFYNSTTSGDILPRASAANPATAAYYLTDRYSNYIWERFSG